MPSTSRQSSGCVNDPPFPPENQLGRPSTLCVMPAPNWALYKWRGWVLGLPEKMCLFPHSPPARVISLVGVCPIPAPPPSGLGGSWENVPRLLPPQKNQPNKKKIRQCLPGLWGWEHVPGLLHSSPPEISTTCDLCMPEPCLHPPCVYALVPRLVCVHVSTCTMPACPVCVCVCTMQMLPVAPGRCVAGRAGPRSSSFVRQAVGEWGHPAGCCRTAKLAGSARGGSLNTLGGGIRFSCSGWSCFENSLNSNPKMGGWGPSQGVRPSGHLPSSSATLCLWSPCIPHPEEPSKGRRGENGLPCKRLPWPHLHPPSGLSHHWQAEQVERGGDSSHH
ncbi:uncharacterized protein LOC120375585 [Mauremys reevesii]|uniref:uncharacterized protein LOC120375585 n=1 Tax=Mauremys reevesii TaxID=260615 RepID=UPI00193F4B51|nr:uncharacterized protein LOC120375585 [Mauremys reevesii]